MGRDRAGSRLVLVADGRHAGPAFKRPTWGQSATRGQAAQELATCYKAFRKYYGIED